MQKNENLFFLKIPDSSENHPKSGFWFYPPQKKSGLRTPKVYIYIYVTWFQPTSVIFLAGGFKHVLFSTFVPMIIRIDWGANFAGWSRPPVFADAKSFGQLFGPQLAKNSVRSLGFGQLFHAPRLLGALNEFLEDCANGPERWFNRWISPLKPRFGWSNSCFWIWNR